MDRHAHLQFVLGVKNAMPAIERLLKVMVDEALTVLPDATWTAAGIGRHQIEVAAWAIGLGGHVRTGLEDNIRTTKDRLAGSNAELVSVTAELVARHGRRVATPAEARAMLRLTIA